MAHNFTRRTLVPIAAALGLTLASGSAQAAAKAIGTCWTYDRAAQALQVTARPRGCISTTQSVNGNTYVLAVDQNHAVISLDGKFTQRNPDARIATADCMGGRNASAVLDAGDIAPRLYTVMHNGEVIGKLDLTNGDAPEDCMVPAHYAAGHQAVPGAVLAKQWQKREAGAQVHGLLADIFSGADSAEVRPTISVTFGPVAPSNTRWTKPRLINRGPDADVEFRIESVGAADDSVAGLRYFGTAIASSDGWLITRLFSQNLCARGTRAGQWSKDPCP